MTKKFLKRAELRDWLRVVATSKAGFEVKFFNVSYDQEEEEEEDDDEPHPPVQEQKRTLGLIILRGETIISISVDAPPPESKRDMPVVCIALITASLSFLFMRVS